MSEKTVSPLITVPIGIVVFLAGISIMGFGVGIMLGKTTYSKK